MHAVVTGASAGIGYETAKALSLRGYTVWMTGRNRKRTLACAERIRRDTGNERVQALVADFASLGSVRALAAELRERAPRLDLLINNAGLWAKAYARSEEGFEMTHAVNHLAPFLLTHELLPSLLHGPARIVFVSSRVHADVGPYIVDRPEPETYRGIVEYGRSKLANLLTSNAFARRLDHTRCTSNALHPGVVQTKIVRANPILEVGIRVVGPLLRTPEGGAQTTLYVACEPSLERVRGAYFSDCRQIPPSHHARDTATADALWTRSLEEVGIRTPHPALTTSP